MLLLPLPHANMKANMIMNIIYSHNRSIVYLGEDWQSDFQNKVLLQEMYGCLCMVSKLVMESLKIFTFRLHFLCSLAILWLLQASLIALAASWTRIPLQA